MPDPESGLKPRPLRRALIVASAAALVALGVLAFLSGPSARLDAWAKARLRAELGRSLGRPVSVATVHVQPLSFSLEARDIIVGEAPPATGKVLEIPVLSVTVAPLGLLSGRIELSSVRLERPRVLWSRSEGRLEGPFPLAGGSRGEKGTWRVVLGRVEVTGGVCSFEDRSVPFWGTADEVSLLWKGDVNLSGEGTLVSERLRGGSGSATLAGRARVEAKIDGGAVAGAAEIALGENWLSVHGSARLGSAPGALPSGEAQVAFKLAGDGGSLSPWAPFKLEEPLTGAIAGSGLVRFTGASWSAEGRLQGEGLRYSDIETQSLDMEVRATNSAIEFRNLTARTMGGRIAGSGQIETRTGGEIRASMSVETVSLARALLAIGLDSPLEGRCSGEGTVTARIGDPASLELRGRVTIAPPPTAPAGDRFATSGEGTIVIEGSRVKFEAKRVQAGQTTVAVKVEKVLGERSVSLEIAAESSSLADTASLLDGFLSRQRGRPQVPWIASHIGGNGHLEGAFRFEEDHPVQGTVRFAFADFAYESIGAESVTGTGTADGSAFALATVRAEKEGGVLILEGNWPEPGATFTSHISGRFEGWPAADALARLGVPGGASVRLAGRMEYREGAGRAEGEADLSLAGASLLGASFTGGRFVATLEGSRIQVSELRLEGPDGTLWGVGAYDIATGRMSASGQGSGIDVKLARERLNGLPFAGHAAVHFRVDRGDTGQLFSLQLSPESDLTFSGKTVRDLELKVEGDGKEARFVGSLGTLASFTGRIAIAEPYEGEGRVALSSAPLGPLLSMSGSELARQITGEVGGEIVWSGPLADPAKLRASASLDPLRLALGTESLELAEPAKLSYSDRVLHLEAVELRGGGGRLAVKGSVPLDPGAGLDLDLQAEIELEYLSGFVTGLSSSGSLRVKLRASGRRDDPELSGTAELDGGRMRIIGFPLVASRIHMTARMGRGAILVDELNAALGGGEYRGAARVDLDGLRPAGWHLEGRVTGASLPLPEGFRGLYNGSLAWDAKSGEAPVLSGRLELVRGTWRREFGLDRVSLGGRVRGAVLEVRPLEQGLTRTTLNLAIHAEDNVWVHNDLADVEGAADIQLQGTIGRPLVTGRFEALEGGEMRFRRVRYQIDQATVIFPPGPRFNPAFDIVAETRVRSFDIRIHFSGNLDRLDYELTSNPPLSQKEILNVLLTGSPAASEAAGGETTGGTNEGPASVVGGEIGGLVGGKLERWLGFEEIRIDPLLLQGTADPTTRVTLGKRLSQRVLVKTSVSLNSPEATIYQVEYQLNRKLKLLLERGELGSTGGDLRYGTRFAYPWAKNGRQVASTHAAKPNKRVTDLVFSGDTGETPSALRRIVSFRKGDEFSRRLLAGGAERLKRHYVKNAYLGAFIRASTREGEGGGVSVEYTVERGPKVSVRLEGAGIQEKRIRESLESLWLDTSFGGDVVGEAEERILVILREAGYYACYVTTRVEPTPAGERVTFKIDDGEKVRVETVEIQGASVIPESEIRRQVLTGEESLFRRGTLKPDTLAADTAAIENLYRTRGYLQVAARSEVSLSSDGRRARVRIEVTEGPSSRLRQVTIHGGTSIDGATLGQHIKARSGDVFLPAVVGEDLEAIRDLYDSKGFPDAHVAEQILSDGDLVDLSYEISEGSPKVLRGVVIEGNSLTKQSVIEREIALQKGEPISRRKMGEIQQRLMRTGLFRDVQVLPEDDPGGETTQVLRIKVREADNLILGVGGGYDTENGPRGSFEIADTNLWGRGRYAGLSVLYGGKLQRVQITLKDPRLFERPWTTIVSSFYERRERESFTERGIGSSLILERKSGERLTHYLKYTAGISEVSGLSVSEATFREAEPKIDLGRLRLASVGYAIVRDARNDPLNTTRGTYASGDLRIFAKPVGSEQRFSKTFLQGSAYLALPLGLTYATSARVGLATQMGSGEPLPLQERYFAGGDASVRGFERDLLGSCEVGTLVPIRHDSDVIDCEDNRASRDSDGDGTPDGRIEGYSPVGGQALVVFNNELRRPIYSSLSAVAFWDSGNTFLRPGDIQIGEFRNTLGLGLRLETPVGPFRVEYGRKLDRRAGESHGEFVFSFGQSF